MIFGDIDSLYMQYRGRKVAAAIFRHLSNKSTFALKIFGDRIIINAYRRVAFHTQYVSVISTSREIY